MRYTSFGAISKTSIFIIIGVLIIVVVGIYLVVSNNSSSPPPAASPRTYVTVRPGNPGSGPQEPAPTYYSEGELSDTSGLSADYHPDCGSNLPIPVRMHVKGNSTTNLHWWVNRADGTTEGAGDEDYDYIKMVYEESTTILNPGDTLVITSWIVGGSGYALSYAYFQAFAPNETNGERVLWISAGNPNNIQFQVNGGNINNPNPPYLDCLVSIGNQGYGGADGSPPYPLPPGIR